ncbi:hypothetical protein A1Q1_07404 [Trichosporon asahii var. asahii CBS 2479]|uniref:F-box domain-containing protein n=1 Tax=Trichosporon asahii var. asahii (strain ATCC 90039 / CBS 2479 / JCM 2466 / KCTC 7840 / NBRC 103889/ NCYC 2677 / UAMH 7654) TaxID=1186058 RepID=J6F7V7_TRIAS|nr:hypothetical protein A1Q1_07404 [Trichosporon asahii var. asahii CBS 2479]EJT51432.1 hypothetical protein A1Q1_07404 [Trichosporon asahii var. asahii CBS 2479]
MVCIDHAYFPHIVDAIFDAIGDPATLAAMAQSCREWRRRCLSLFYAIRGYYILEDDPVPTVVVWDQFDRVLYFEGRSQIVLLSECHMLDFRSDSQINPEPAWFLFKVGVKRYVRHVSIDVEYEAPQVPVQHIACQNDVPAFDFWNPAVKLLTIHCAKPEAKLRCWDRWGGCHEEAELTGLTSLERVVVIFEHTFEDLVEYEHESDYAVSPNSSSYTLNPYESDAYNHLRHVRNLIAAARQQGAELFLVGTESFSSDAVADLRLEDGYSLQSYQSALDSDRSIHLVTLESYRRGIGEKEWALQTNWRDPLFP